MACSTFWQGISDLDCIAYDLQSMGVLAMKSSGMIRCLLAVFLLHVFLLLHHYICLYNRIRSMVYLSSSH
jgi:hypothetical protein